ncbi:NAD(P)H-binding protein [Micromonospora terminaliae]|uniref:NAD(P)H-binding protein n=1 Tax=Micromonospora terminaliae TaxID=1914461 RepID=A0AAJ2Z9X6_9ACTN|nr:NAD(P)H-binding protein [Micromonospora terminaliae]NES26112.1 NAD(P)H-binding protein [Micromonospora terminaliae]QGL50312.1 NAD(P)H-binding protein [Micromonospora terminaliae]
MILVTGATGNVGRRVVERLAGAGHGVRAVTRDPARASLPAGVEAVAADLADPETLRPHLDGVRAVFLIWPFVDPATTAQLAPRVAAVLADAGSPRVVYVSAATAEADPNSFWALVERAVVAAGLPWTMLRPTGIATNALAWAESIRSEGVVRWPYGAAARSMVHEDDIAAVAVEALTTDRHDGQTYVLSGPQTVTQAEQVRIIGAAIGRDVRWQDVPAEAVRPMLAAAMGSAAFADAALTGWAAMAETPEQVTGDVAAVLGRPARTFAHWAADHAADFA